MSVIAAGTLFSHRTGSSLTLALAVTLFAFSGCQSSQDSSDEPSQTIRFATVTPLQSFDPHQSDTGPPFTTYLTLVYDGLTGIDPGDSMGAIPGLAREWEWLSETEIEFRLVDDVTFSDGVSFDAYAAKANLDRALRLRGPRFNTVRTIKGVEVIDALTLRISLHQPDPTLLKNLALSPGLMVSPAAFDNADLDLNPVGTGPWIYDKANSTIGEIHSFIPRKDYFDPVIRSDAHFEVHIIRKIRTRLNALIAGEIDLIGVTGLEASQATEMGFGIARRANRWFGMSILDRNGETVPELGDPRVRQAIGFAIDRQALAEALFFGYAAPASQPMAKGLGHVPELENFYRYDPEYSRQLLKSAGVETFSFTVPVGPDASSRYEAIQHYVRKIGINMEIEIVDPGSISAHARSRRFPVNTIAPPNFDPDSRHLAIWETTAIWNPFRINNERLNSLAHEAIISSDEALREANYREYFDILVKDVRTLVLLQIDDLVAYDSDKLTGVALSTYVDPDLRYVRLLSDTD